MAWDGERYQERFDALAADGHHVHGEADFVHAFGPAAVLDAGCGTGRVAIELGRRGVAAVGVDRDESMLATARRLAPDLTWLHSDLAALDLGRSFDVVVMAGNVLLFTPDGTQPAVVRACGSHLRPGGLLVAGFQLGRGYELDDYDAACVAVDLELVERWSTWDRDPWTVVDGYAVSVHRRVAER